MIKSKITGAFDSYDVICGYENDRFYSLFGDDVQPQKYPERFFELISVKDKKVCPSPAEIMRQAVPEIPCLLTASRNRRLFLRNAGFSDWADSLQNGTFRQFDDDDPVW